MIHYFFPEGSDDNDDDDDDDDDVTNLNQKQNLVVVEFDCKMNWNSDFRLSLQVKHTKNLLLNQIFTVQTSHYSINILNMTTPLLITANTCWSPKSVERFRNMLTANGKCSIQVDNFSKKEMDR